MGNDGQFHPPSGWPQILLVLVLAVGAVWVQLPIQTHRPPPVAQGVRTAGLQDVDARLWQDPFVAAENAKQPGSTTSAHTIDRLVRAVGAQQGNIEIVAVLVPGSPRVGADELRRRIRYAVLAGLSVQGYVPHDPEHVGYVEDQSQGWHVRMPFEWLDDATGNESASPSRTLILWLDEGALAQQNPAPAAPATAPARGPLARLVALLEELNRADGEKVHLHFTVLGPTSSTFLKQVMEELEGNSSAVVQRLAKLSVHWYSPSATLPDPELILSDGHRLVDVLPRFQRTIVSDDKLIDALFGELGIRGICARGETVALVGQWDTAYARALRARLKTAIGETPECPDTRIVSVSYLRGIDGQLPGTNSSTSKTNEEGRRNVVERPEGRAQIDYLRRLAKNLVRREDSFGRIGAIGVLGDDYHDKLLVLEALRPIFPAAVFFTTDLDAAMLHPSDNEVTRNLVVASAYGLQARPVLQEDIPPFRSTYQTSFFLATRFALETSASNAPAKNDIRFQSGNTAQIYEIGRTEAVSLTPQPQSGDCNSITDCNYPYASGDSPPSLKGALLVPIGLAVAWLLGVTAGFVHRHHTRYWLAAIGITTVLATLLALFLSHTPEHREPLNWLQGISVWPSEFLRIIAFAASIALILRGRKKLRERRELIEQEFFGAAPVGISETHFANRRSVSRYVSYTWAVLKHGIQRRTPTGNDSGPLSARVLWDTYCQRNAVAAGPCYVQLPFGVVAVLFVVVFFGLGLLLPSFGMDPPKTPARGAAEFVIDRAILLPTVVAFLSLLVFAMHESDRAVWLIGELRKSTNWPANALENVWPASAPADERRRFDEWLDVRFIGTMTEPVQHIIFDPFAILALLIVSRSSLFDRWNIPDTLILIFGLAIAFVAIAALRLRAAVERMRTDSTDRLQLSELECKAKGLDKLARQLAAVRSNVRTYRTGAFAPFSQQPLVKAALTVTGTVSGIALLEYASLANF